MKQNGVLFSLAGKAADVRSGAVLRGVNPRLNDGKEFVINVATVSGDILKDNDGVDYSFKEKDGMLYIYEGTRELQWSYEYPDDRGFGRFVEKVCGKSYSGVAILDGMTPQDPKHHVKEDHDSTFHIVPVDEGGNPVCAYQGGFPVMGVTVGNYTQMAGPEHTLFPITITNKVGLLREAK